MKEIQLTQGKVALVDDEEYERVSKHKWYAKKGNSTYYAACNIYNKETRKQKHTLLHRFILNIKETSIEVDHINHNGLDNRKLNLRETTPQQNSRNRRMNKIKNGRYKGVYRHTYRSKKDGSFLHYRYLAKIGYNGAEINIGLFHTDTEAAIAYNKKAIELHGEFAHINIIAPADLVAVDSKDL